MTPLKCFAHGQERVINYYYHTLQPRGIAGGMKERGSFTVAKYSTSHADCIRFYLF